MAASFHLRIPALDAVSKLKWIALESFAPRSAGGHVSIGGTGGAGAGKVTVISASILKRVDDTSPTLLKWAGSSNKLEEAAVHLGGLPPGAANAVALMKKVFVDTVQWVGGTGDGPPMETVEVSFDDLRYMSLAQYLGLKGGAAALYNLASWFH